MSELDNTIGNEERQTLTAGTVLVKTVEVQAKESEKEGKKKIKFKIVQLGILHPDKEEIFHISNLKIKKVQGNNETIMKDGIWYREDSKGKIDMNCNAAKLLKHYNKNSLKELENTSVTTELDNAGYLCIKAY